MRAVDARLSIGPLYEESERARNDFLSSSWELQQSNNSLDVSAILKSGVGNNGLSMTRGIDELIEDQLRVLADEIRQREQETADRLAGGGSSGRLGNTRRARSAERNLPNRSLPSRSLLNHSVSSFPHQLNESMEDSYLGDYTHGMTPNPRSRGPVAPVSQRISSGTQERLRNSMELLNPGHVRPANATPHIPPDTLGNSGLLGLMLADLRLDGKKDNLLTSPDRSPRISLNASNISTSSAGPKHAAVMENLESVQNNLVELLKNLGIEAGVNTEKDAPTSIGEIGSRLEADMHSLVSRFSAAEESEKQMEKERNLRDEEMREAGRREERARRLLEGASTPMDYVLKPFDALSTVEKWDPLVDSRANMLKALENNPLETIDKVLGEDNPNASSEAVSEDQSKDDGTAKENSTKNKPFVPLGEDAVKLMQLAIDREMGAADAVYRQMRQLHSTFGNQMNRLNLSNNSVSNSDIRPYPIMQSSAAPMRTAPPCDYFGGDMSIVGSDTDGPRRREWVPEPKIDSRSLVTAARGIHSTLTSTMDTLHARLPSERVECVSPEGEKTVSPDVSPATLPSPPKSQVPVESSNITVKSSSPSSLPLETTDMPTTTIDEIPECVPVAEEDPKPVPDASAPNVPPPNPQTKPMSKNPNSSASGVQTLYRREFEFIDSVLGADDGPSLIHPVTTSSILASTPSTDTGFKKPSLPPSNPYHNDVVSLSAPSAPPVVLLNKVKDEHHPPAQRNVRTDHWSTPPPPVNPAYRPPSSVHHVSVPPSYTAGHSHHVPPNGHIPQEYSQHGVIYPSHTTTEANAPHHTSYPAYSSSAIRPPSLSVSHTPQSFPKHSSLPRNYDEAVLVASSTVHRRPVEGSAWQYLRQQASDVHASPSYNSPTHMPPSFANTPSVHVPIFNGTPSTMHHTTPSASSDTQERIQFLQQMRKLRQEYGSFSQY